MTKKMKQGLCYVNIISKMQLFPWCKSFGINTIGYSLYIKTVEKLLMLLSTAIASPTPPHTHTSFPQQPPPSRHFWKSILLHFTSPFDTLSSCTGRTQQMTEYKPEWTARVDTETGKLWEFHLNKSQAGGFVPFCFLVLWEGNRRPTDG